jgi:hypothetical protein
LIVIGGTSEQPLKACGTASIVPGVIAPPLLPPSMRHAPEAESAMRDCIGTRCLIAFTWRLAIVATMPSSSRAGLE